MGQPCKYEELTNSDNEDAKSLVLFESDSNHSDVPSLLETSHNTTEEKSTALKLMEYLIKKQDPIDAFLSSLAPTLKSFSPQYQHLAKGKIFAIVHELEAQQLNQAFTPPYTSSSGASFSRLEMMDENSTQQSLQLNADTKNINTGIEVNDLDL